MIAHSREETANVLTHLIGVVAALILTPILLVQATSCGLAMTVGIALLSGGMLMMYTASCIYHGAAPGNRKRRLRILDHSSIFVMIAGSYSPILIGVLGRGWGWTLFIVLWSITLLGVVAKIFTTGRFPRLSLALYLSMGWVALLIIKPLWQYLPRIAFFSIVAEGVFYSLGSYFFAHDEEHAYYHAIWHLFILFGTAAHITAIFQLLNPHQ